MSWRDFWENPTILHWYRMMTYHKKIIVAGKNHMHGGTDNLYKYWDFQAKMFHALDEWKANNKPVFKPELIRVIKENKVIRIIQQKQVPVIVEEEVWVPKPLCWD